MTAARTSATIELLQSQSLNTLVQHELERQILSGEVEPGAKLNEADVAAQLNVSRGPVREAFRALEQAGLLRTEKNRGVFVREIAIGEADEIYEVRAGLDELIGRLAAERVSPAQLEQLRELLKQMQKSARARNVDDYYPLNLRFHDLLAQFAGNQKLLSTYRRLVNELHLFRRETLARGPNSFPISTREHAGIVDALARGDGDAAARLLYGHAIESRERLHATLKRPADAEPARPRRQTKTA
jgi:phosphonate utilization transcriptional regulator